MNQETIDAGSVTGETGGVKFLRRFIEINYFYVFSAILMMLGCYLLMRSNLIRGSEFMRTFWTWLILQGYEVLVIAAAILIVRHFVRMGDALTLLIIELALMLDPTFFSNSFFTMLSVKSTAVNVAGFLLVPVKLLILQRMLYFRMRPRMFGAFMFAAAFVYLFEGPFNIRQLPISYDGYYYLLGWAPLILAFLLPPMKEMVDITSGNPEFMTRRQKESFPWFLLALPFAVCCFHYIESSQVYALVRFYWVYGAPLLLAVTVLIVNNTSSRKIKDAILLIDAISIVALFLSYGMLNQEGKNAIFATDIDAPVFIRKNITFYVTALGIIIVYLYIYMRHQYRPALARPLIIALLGVGYGIYKVGIVQSVVWAAVAKSWGVIEAVGGGIVFAITVSGKWIAAHPWLIYLAVLMALIVAASYVRHLLLWLFVGICAVLLLFYILPLQTLMYAPEIVGLSFVWLLVLYHIFNYPFKERYTAVFMIVAIGLGRFMATPASWSGGAVVAECLALIAIGIIFSYTGYLLFGLIQGAMFAVALFAILQINVPIEIMVVGGGIAFFLLGLLVTFYKEGILTWIQNFSAAAAYRREQTVKLSAQKAAAAAAKARNAISPADQTEPDFPERAPAFTSRSRKNAEESIEEPGVEGFGDQAEGAVDLDTLRRTRALIESLFITQEEEGMHLARDIDPGMLEDISSSLPLYSDEEVALLITESSYWNYGMWRAMLTTRRLFFREKVDTPVSVAYSQISSVSRSHATLYFKGHAGQVLSCDVLDASQCAYLKRGLESLLFELAEDAPSTDKTDKDNG